MASSSKRSLYFDNAKLILIFLVVFGHVISPLKGNDDILFTLYTVIFLFHMPAFILISGYFAKGYRKKGYLIKSVKKILLPYLIFQAIYSFFYFISGDEKSLTIDFLQPHWTLWFLLSLFCWNVLIYAFAKLKWIGLFACCRNRNRHRICGSRRELFKSFKDLCLFPIFSIGVLN
ncbi:acyltransferase family protein [Heyndrickxia vini]|uniref:acyltransferase family protein n=1 Tax=Heyndrickxia vini TaxID=1476025 RepID=UPI00248341E4|nr:acyltransferase family protein [Heyndrickxia vini]